MRDWAGKRYWLVGASEGLGAALAGIMSRSGAHLILSARSTDRLEALAVDLPGPTEVVPVDVSDDASVKAAAEQVGEIDGMVFLAGVYWPMAAQNWDYLQANAMADINFTGLMRVLGVTVPQMVARDAGHIVVTGSLSGYRGLPGAVGYAASKAGTMVLAEGLYADLRGTGIDVQLANPGFIRTRLTEKNDFTMPAIMEPERAAQIMFDHMNSDHFQRAFPVPFAWLFRLGQLLPDWLYFRLFA
ncbi:SDR family NAD(P)-dependent oxidoreductase [Ruegeria sp. 2012CJ41-6]|uniref:SDR family NAD(P)-dependent oxidoreductase n=1 Tax=Ruegeria spongiae TaxID=2942209 RepID=A0ABT0Q1B4_9RHOB|nr:SDR family NAD(P)-dependent oxidoreductase [Ruegeria spongiae]MCL6283673.1 SDR family NAD(P)-dependent oxidoreductase [Ruegeria spongiae]